MDLESQIKHTNKSIRNAKMIRSTSKKILKNQSNINSDQIIELSKIMTSVIIGTNKAMKDAQMAESRAKSRLEAVKKATAKTVSHIKNANYAAITSRKAANAALMTSKKMSTHHLGKKYQKIYNIQINEAIRAAKASEIETSRALKTSRTARIAARMVLKEMKI